MAKIVIHTYKYTILDTHICIHLEKCLCTVSCYIFYIIISLLETDCSLEELESHSCNFPDMVMAIEHRQARDYHVSVPDGLHLQNVAIVTLTILQPTLPKCCESHAHNIAAYIAKIPRESCSQYCSLHCQNVARVTLTKLQSTLPKLKKTSVRIYIL